ncbi:MAG: Rha family transcriptional regulator [Deltaproteobacteria bacterium]|jgi:Rha family phage regulatory protein|nr:Rha family transcriptional regulator [Deltaproteobacteria bacterium]
MAHLEVSVLVYEGKAVVSSREVALRFQKKHKEILRDIERIRAMCPKDFIERNFALNEYTDSIGRALPCYNLTRDAFSLLAMGFTGKAAILWKLKYIDAFNALEAAALDRARAEALACGAARALPPAVILETAAKQGYLDGIKEGRRLMRGRDDLARAGKIRRYENKGLSRTEIGRLIGCHRDTVRKILARVRRLAREV